MDSAAMPAIANFLMRTSVERLPEDGRAHACNQLTDRTDGLPYQYVILPRHFDGHNTKLRPPAKARLPFAGGRISGEILFAQELLAGGRRLTVVQPPRRQIHRHQTRRHRTETEVETQIREIASTQSGSCYRHFSATGPCWTAMGPPADDR